MTELVKILLAAVFGLSFGQHDFRGTVPYPYDDSQYKTTAIWRDTGFYPLSYLEKFKSHQPIVTQYLTHVCQKLAPGENFRLEDLTDENCPFFGSCFIKGGEYSIKWNGCHLTQQREFYDVDLQECRPAAEVKNCAKPFGDRETVLKALNKEKVEIDLTENCNAKNCKFPKCYCSKDGTGIPGNIPRDKTPQIIMISYSGAVTPLESSDFREIFHDLKNPNNCSAKGTFFVSHKYTDYSVAEEFYNYGHEIGAFSVTNKDDSSYWITSENGTYEEEFGGSRQILENFANVKSEDVVGIRVPYMYLGGEMQFQMMEKNDFVYDSTVTVAHEPSKVPVWPYNLKFGMPHPCNSLHDENCPRFATPYDLWEIPLNEIDPSLVEAKSRIHRVISCPNLSNCRFQDGEHFYKVLRKDFLYHYENNKAPINWFFLPSFFRINFNFMPLLRNLLSELQTEYPDVYIVTQKQALDWIRNPTPSDRLDNFELWKGEKCDVDPRSGLTCRNPKPCSIPTYFKGIPETITMYTCNKCPYFYPWLNNTKGNRPN